jgi:hypothetical protein
MEAKLARLQVRVVFVDLDLFILREGMNPDSQRRSLELLCQLRVLRPELPSATAHRRAINVILISVRDLLLKNVHLSDKTGVTVHSDSTFRTVSALKPRVKVKILRGYFSHEFQAL